MKLPQPPPDLTSIQGEFASDQWARFISDAAKAVSGAEYFHWDEIIHRTPPRGLTHRQWWFAMKLARMDSLKAIGLIDKHGKPFKFSVPDSLLETLHQLDQGISGSSLSAKLISDGSVSERHLMNSLLEEAITSSQLEGAATTREVAREMIRTGRKPKDLSERMILNNYLTMRRIQELCRQELSPDLVFEIHRIVTDQTLADPDAAGRLRRPDERRFVADDYGRIFLDPPEAVELPDRLRAMCDFANAKEPGAFIHPVIRAILLHFWLAFDHPFVDGNGRTARALFYWAALRAEYWIFKYASISAVLRKSHAQYGRSFLYTETDDNDMTYFLVSQIRVIRRAIDDLRDYVDLKTRETRETEGRIRTLKHINPRQVELIEHALKHPGYRYTMASHQRSHGVAYETARKDLMGLAEKGLLIQTKRGKQLLFGVPPDLAERLKKI